MWLFTTIGFFSVVQKRGDQDLTVRARAASDLDRLRERYLPSLGPTIANAGTDYRYRALVSHKDLAMAMASIVSEIDYSNFKNEVRATLGARREHVMHDIWSAAARIEEESDG